MGSRRKTGVEGVHIVKTQRVNDPLRWYIYAWRGGPKIRTQIGGARPTLTRDDIAAIAAAIEKSKPQNADTMRGLIASYRSEANPDWAALAVSTKRLWSNCLDHIMERWGDVPLNLWNNPRMVTKIMTWRDSMAKTPRSADNHIATLYRLLEYGRLRARVTVNLANGIPNLYKGGQRASIIWTDEDFAKAEKHFSPVLMDVIRFAAMTGLRRGDLAAVQLSDVGDFAIRRLALKRSAGKRRKVITPIIPGMRELLNVLKTRKRKAGITTLLVTSFGDAWTPTGLNSSIYTAIRKADISYIDENGEKQFKHLHDLRGTFATKLMTIPGERLTDEEIADLMGWSVQQVSEIRRHYVDEAAIVVALGKRLANISVKQDVKQ
jgi:integrase